MSKLSRKMRKSLSYLRRMDNRCSQLSARIKSKRLLRKSYRAGHRYRNSMSLLKKNIMSWLQYAILLITSMFRTVRRYIMKEVKSPITRSKFMKKTTGTSTDCSSPASSSSYEPQSDTYSCDDEASTTSMTNSSDPTAPIVDPDSDNTECNCESPPSSSDYQVEYYASEASEASMSESSLVESSAENLGFYESDDFSESSSLMMDDEVEYVEDFEFRHDDSPHHHHQPWYDGYSTDSDIDNDFSVSLSVPIVNKFGEINADSDEEYEGDDIKREAITPPEFLGYAVIPLPKSTASRSEYGFVNNMGSLAAAKIQHWNDTFWLNKMMLHLDVISG